MFKSVMCFFGLHWSGTVDGGAMGDAICCDHCGMDKYPEVFGGIIIHKRNLPKSDFKMPGSFHINIEECHDGRQ